MKGAYSGAAAIALATMTSLAAATGTVSSNSIKRLALSSSQQHTIYRDINREVKPQKMPSGFNPAAGSTMPSKVQVYTMPADVAKDVTAVKQYDYALVSKPYDFILHQRQVLLVDPKTKKIVDIISQ